MLKTLKGKYSISLAQSSKIAIAHDNREYTPPNADKALADRNIYILQTKDIKSEFNKLFREAIELYNAKQPRHDRRKSLDYYTELKQSCSHEKPLYEAVIQIGNNFDNGVTDNDFDVEHWKELKKQGKFKSASKYALAHLNRSQTKRELKTVLLNIANQLEKKYSNLKFWNIALHDDEVEGTAHVHAVFSPIAQNCFKNGLDKRCSLTKALEQMGFKTVGNAYAITQFQNNVKDYVEHEMSRFGYGRAYMNNNNKHLSVSQFKYKTETEKLLKKKTKLEEEKAVLDFSIENKKRVQKELDEQALHAREAIKQLKALEKELEEKQKNYKAKLKELARIEKELADKSAFIRDKEEKLQKRERVLNAELVVERINPKRRLPDIDFDYI